MDIKNRPKPDAKDAIHIIIKSALSAIPVAGGPAAELFTALFIPPIIKRRDAWIESLGQAILDLKERSTDLNLEDLQNNEHFVTAVLYATNSALRTHDKEKLESLKNAILNVALKIAPDEDLQLIFLNHIDQLTRWHLRILSFFSSPEEWYKVHNREKPDPSIRTIYQLLESTFDELKGTMSLCEQVVHDLYSRGFIMKTDLLLRTSIPQLFSPRVTSIGDDFLDFIKNPNQLLGEFDI